MATVRVVPQKSDLADVQPESILCVKADGRYLMAFDKDAAEIFNTPFEILHPGDNYLTAYRKGKGTYTLFVLGKLDPEHSVLHLELLQPSGGNPIGNPPPHGK